MLRHGDRNGHYDMAIGRHGPTVSFDKSVAKVEDKDADGSGQEEHREKKRFRRSSQACKYCQQLKMKCSGSVPCERCSKMGRECEVSMTSGRKRGPWTKRRDVEIQRLTNRLKDMEQRLEILSDNQQSLQPLTSVASVPVDTPGSISSRAAGTPLLATSLSFATSLSEMPLVRTGKVTTSEAVELYTLYMHNCNIHVPVLDPDSHTIWQTSSTCPFLFACIIHVAATYCTHRPTLRKETLAEINELVGTVIASGEKNVGIVQAFLVLYFYNSPSADLDKDLAWTYSGLAIRMAIDISLNSSARTSAETDRERVDRERTWMFCFLVDRTQSTARGKRWTLHGSGDAIISNASLWYSQPANRSWDLCISALADLLNVTTRQTDVLNDILLGSDEHSSSFAFDCDMTMRLLNDELQEWRKRWFTRGFFTSPLGEDMASDSPASIDSDRVDVHTRILHFLTRQAFLRFHHAVLVLNCAGLQACAMHAQRSDARTYILTQAIRAAQGVVIAAKDGLRHTVAYAPHTQCTIISFAMISLIKIASMKRIDDAVVSHQLLELAGSGIAFLDSVALRPNHIPARCASMLRGLLRRSNQIDLPSTSFRPGMEQHPLPVRSSRAVTPSTEHQQHQQQHTDTTLSATTNTAPSSFLNLSSQMADKEVVDQVDSASTMSSTSFSLFGNEGSLGLAQMTADEILDDSFWLCLPP